MSVIIALALIFVCIILALLFIYVFFKEEPYNPPQPPPPDNYYFTNNGYFLNNSQISSYGTQTYTLKKDQYAKPNDTSILENPTNTFINESTMQVSIVKNHILRLKFDYNMSDSDRLTQAGIDDLIFSDDFKRQSRKPLISFSNYGFKVISTNMNSNGTQKAGFGMSIFNSQTNLEYINTVNQSFYMMTQYIEFGFQLKCDNILGLGQRLTNTLTQVFKYGGSFTMYPYMQKNSFAEDGKGTLQGYGSHPFLMIQSSNDFVGLYIHNTNPMEIRIQFLDQFNTKAQVTIVAVGGILDLFFFYGPTYQKVVKQYEFVIGKPAMLPYWSNGVISKSGFYTSNSNVMQSLNGFTQSTLMLDVIALPIESMQGRQNMNSIINENEILKNFPLIRFIYPFTHFIPSNLDNLIPFVSLGNGYLNIQINGNAGFCLDVFKTPDIQTYILQTIKQSKKISYSIDRHGFWLEGNMPQADQNNGQSFKGFNPFANILLQPNNTSFEDNSIPLYANHSQFGNENQSEYHAKLHSIFGTQMLSQMQEVLSSTDKSAFIISDSTFPGAGKYGVAHILQRELSSNYDYQQAMVNIVNFNMFGIPNVGTNLGGYLIDQDTDISWIVRYFQLAFISPISIQNLQSNLEQSLMYKFPPEFLGLVKQMQMQRMQYLVYMRTELFKISKHGGTLVRPVYADYPGSFQYTIDDYTSLMFGEAMRVELNQQWSGQSSKFCYFIIDKWFDLIFENVIQKSSSWITIPNNGVRIYQKSNGTMIVYQMSNWGTSAQLTSIDQIYQFPICLSFYTDSTLYATSQGTVYIEWNNQQSYYYNYYGIKMRNGMISFQIFEGNTITSIETLIDAIRIIEVPFQTNQACAFSADPNLNSFGDILTLGILPGTFSTYLNPIQSVRGQMADLQSVKLIFFGQATDLTQLCDQTIVNMRLEQVLHQDDYSVKFKITQNLRNIEPLAYDIYLNITILSNNSIYFFYSFAKYSLYDTPTSVYDRNFTKFANKPRIKLVDVVYWEEYPFFFEVHAFQDRSTVYYTTEGENNVFHLDLNVFSARYPSLDSRGKFYGLGERNGDFYIHLSSLFASIGNDQYVSLFANSNNVQSSMKQHGKNGYFPILFSQIAQSPNITCMWTISSVGHEMQLNQNSSRVSTFIPHSNLEQVFIFNLGKKETSITLNDHIQLGNLLNQNNYSATMPPPEWAFGQFYSFTGVNSQTDLQNKIDNLKKFNFPFEGLFMDLDDLDNYNSYSFNFTKYNSSSLLSYFNSINAALIQIDKSSVSLTPSNSSNLQFLLDNKLLVKRQNLTFGEQRYLIGRDNTGDVVYPDYSVYQSSSNYIDLMVNSVKGQYPSKQLGIQMKYNEITNTDCNGDCYLDDQDDIYNLLLFKIGSPDQMRHTLGYNARKSYGREHDVHNLNGLTQQIAFSNSKSNSFSRMPVFSDSTAVGSGKLGFVCRLIDYIDPQVSYEEMINAASILQTQSTVGMPNIGFKIIQHPGQPFNATTILFSSLNPISHFMISDPFTAPISLSTLRYSMLKYTRTHSFVHINTGVPLVRHISYEFPIDELEVIQESQRPFYMYGPSVLALLQDQATYNSKQIPSGYWCIPSYYSPKSQFCITVSTVSISEPTSQNVFLRNNYITPLQNAVNGVFNSFSLQNINIDLHIVFSVPSKNNRQAAGQIFIEGPNNLDGESFCFIEMNFQKDKLQFSKSSQFGGNGQCKYDGFEIGSIIFYCAQDPSVADFNQASLIIINQPSNPKTVAITQDEGKYHIADFSKASIHLSEIDYIQFQ